MVREFDHIDVVYSRDGIVNVTLNELLTNCARNQVKAPRKKVKGFQKVSAVEEISDEFAADEFDFEIVTIEHTGK